MPPPIKRYEREVLSDPAYELAASLWRNCNFSGRSGEIRGYQMNSETKCDLGTGEDATLLTPTEEVGSCPRHQQSAIPSSEDSALVQRDPLADPLERQNWLHTLFEGVETGIFVIDPETHTIVDANSIALRMVGASREEIVGRLCHRFVCPAENGRCPVTDLGQAVDNSERILLTNQRGKRNIIKTVRTVESSGRKLLLESFVDITDLKNTEAALKERTAYLHSLIEATPLGVLVLDAANRIEMSNAAFERLFQYPRAETLGAGLRDLVGSDELAAEMEELRRQCMEQGKAEIATRRRRKDGKFLHVQIFAVRLEVDGKPHGMLALYEDITARREAEISLAEQMRLAALVAEVGFVLTGADSLPQGLQRCSDIIANHLNAAGVCIWTVNECDNVLELKASAGTISCLNGGAARIPVGSCTIGKIAKDGEPYLSNQMIGEPCARDPEWVRQQGVVAFAGYPLKVNERVLAVMAAFSRQPMNPGTMQSFVSISDSVAQFIERKRAEDSLRESENQFRTAFENAPYGMCMTRLNGQFLNANAALCAMLGYSKQELESMNWQRITHPEDLERSRRSAIELIQGDGNGIELENRIVHKSGRTVSARLRVSPVRLVNGALSHFITQVEDVTLQKQADQERAFLASLVESSPDAIIGKTTDGIVVSWNPGAEELYGYSSAEMVGKPLSKLVLPERIAELTRALEGPSRGEPTSRLETVMVRKNGTHVNVALTVSSVRNAAKQVTGTVTVAHDITSRKQREQHAHLLTAALESVANGIVIADREGQILWVNPAFTDLTGYAADDVIGNNPRLLKSGQHDKAYYEELWSTILEGNPWRGEIVNRRKDGTSYHEEMIITPVREEDGAIHHFVAIKQDITDRKLAEEELLFKTTLLETEAETSIDGILVVDRNGRILQSNRRFAEIFRIPPSVLETNDEFAVWDAIKHRFPDPASNERRVEYLYAHDLEKARDEISLIDGRCIDRYTAPLQGSSGKYYGRVWYFRDITESKKAEQAMRENEQRYRELFENASEIIFTTDLEGRFVSLNRAAERALGYSQDRAAPTNIWNVALPEYWEGLKQGRTRMMAGETSLTTEIEVSTKDERRLRLEVNTRLIRQGDRPIGIQAIARDVTGRDIAEMEIRQAQKLESVGRLASGIAHEINTPIQFVGDNARFLEESFASLKKLLDKFSELRDAAVSGTVSAELLSDLRKTEEELDCSYLLDEIPPAISQTMEGVDRVATIVRALKEFAHPEGREMAPADLNKALLSTITVARNEWKYVAEVETRFGDLPPVICNIGDVNQVFLNLLVNAAHAISDVVKGGGKGKITICTALDDNKVHVSIADSGTGIPEEIRSRIFDPFFTTKEVGRGTGQGLAIARTVIVERHKGTMSFESEVGKGTTFHIRLPITPAGNSKEGGDK